ncbi:MAG: radical SAM family heme chaperone HemW [Flavobacteriaceae bacterium]|nr:radical SAM family heme chaperone HemW [Flavobacteriaceae bacterium]
MSGIYIHIPFCKQACHYCDFHFSTNLTRQQEVVDALIRELSLRKDEFRGVNVESIYFGGGTPSLLTPQQVQLILEHIGKNFQMSGNPEITLEANPDDLDKQKIYDLSTLGINRLSIGVQSFFEADLRLMNRSHNVQQAIECLDLARALFDNISIDLIYGIPGRSLRDWKSNIVTIARWELPHISSYALTVEPKTALAHQIKMGTVSNIDEAAAHRQFEYMVQTLVADGFEHYEISNFGKPGYYSKNNTAYWLGKTYMGIGPSAHSYNGKERSWNIRNNKKYLDAIQESTLPSTVEKLSEVDRYNEKIMTGLRTQWGVDLHTLTEEFGKRYMEYALEQAKPHIKRGVLSLEGQYLKSTAKGKFLIDGIASELFMVNLG